MEVPLLVPLWVALRPEERPANFSIGRRRTARRAGDVAFAEFSGTSDESAATAHILALALFIVLDFKVLLVFMVVIWNASTMNISLLRQRVLSESNRHLECMLIKLNVLTGELKRGKSDATVRPVP